MLIYIVYYIGTEISHS